MGDGAGGCTPQARTVKEKSVPVSEAPTTIEPEEARGGRNGAPARERRRESRDEDEQNNQNRRRRREIARASRVGVGAWSWPDLSCGTLAGLGLAVPD